MKDGEKKVKKVAGLNINLTNCKYELLREISGSLGFNIVEEDEWVLFWIDTGVSLERVLDMKSFQRINHFPGMHEICRKDHLARKVGKLSRLFPKDYNFFPKSWILPHDFMDFKHSFKPKKGQCFISKPDHGCQGKGIFLFRDPDELDESCKLQSVIQSYISSPLLIDGFKFDLRVYVLVTSVNPLRIFIYKDGLARFATEPYQTPNSRNISRTCMHLTNYAINKNSKGFVVDEESGSKRSIKMVLQELEKLKDVKQEVIWNRIKDVIVKTIITVQPALCKLVKPWFPTSIKTPMTSCGSQCFEILGFDILLDSKLKAWVLEVNHSPSFTCDTQLDRDIKAGVIGDAMKLLNITFAHQSKKKFTKDQKQQSLSRLLKPNAETRVEKTLSETTLINEHSHNDQFAKEINKYYEKYNQQVLEKLTEFEDVRLGDYERIFPPQDTEKLGKYLYLIHETSNWSTETNATKARKAYQEFKQQQENRKQIMLEKWKQKQQTKKHINPKVSTSSNLLNFKKQLEMLDINTLKRADYTRQLYQDASSPLPPREAKKTIPMKIQNMSDSFHVSRPYEFNNDARYTSYASTIAKYSDLFSMNPLIEEKKKELSRITLKMNTRLKRSYYMDSA
ncbi:Tubulin polyglutamylase ttll6 [Boothiomyces sp. JEL0866]|nr:Tubulin polyglutamylase ttll6 [Boothiomyces sp. JEL0866]